MVLEFEATEKEIGQLTRGVMVRSGRLYAIFGVGLCCGPIVIALGNAIFGVILMIAVLAGITCQGPRFLSIPSGRTSPRGRQGIP
jgi:hypothetical protein